METLLMFFKVLVFPGLFFLFTFGMITEFIDRKLYARMQSRTGPKWYIPIADFFKLIGKKSVFPRDANEAMMRIMPIVSTASVAAAFTYIPAVGMDTSFSFKGDLIMVLYFLAFPALTLFLGGWYSRSPYATIGATRVVTQMFAYEVPLFMSLLAPAIIAGSWSVSEIAEYYSQHPLTALINIPAFFVTVAAAQCKLERVPFDAPEAETEIVSGPYVEYGGRLLAFWKASSNCETIVLLSLISAVFLPFSSGIAAVDVVLYFVKVLAVLFILVLLRAVAARLRVNQTVAFCWKVLAPVALLQIVVNLIVGRWL